MKSIIIMLTVLFTAIFTPSIRAQFPDNIQYQSIAPPAIGVPNYLDEVIDNSVPNPIQITRVTDYSQAWDWYPVHEYTKTQVWNADQSLIRIRSWKLLNATTFAEVQDLSGDIYPSYWSNTNPDLIWSFKENGDVKKHIVSTNSTTTVATIQGYEFIELGPGEGNIDKNDHYVALVGKNGVDLDVIIFNLQTLQIIHTETFAGVWGNGGSSFPEYVDWVSISQSGDYVVIMWNHNTTSENNPYNTHYGVEVYNTLDMQFQNRIMSYGNHGDLGYAIDGDEVLVQFYGWYGNGTVYMHKLDGSGSTVLTTNTDFGVAAHLSCRNINRPGWAYVVHNSEAQTGQIVAIKLDNSGLTEHFGHHFSSSTTYDKTPMPVPSPDGDKVFFRSDFGDSANPDLTYCFEAKVAAPLAIEQRLSLSGEIRLHNTYLSFVDNLGLEGTYYLYKSNDANYWKEIYQVVSNSKSNYEYEDIKSDFNQYYKLVFKSIEGEVYNSNILKIKAVKNSIVVGPNPSNGILQLYGLNNTSCSIDVFDVKGELLTSYKDVKNQLDLSDLPIGIYTLNIEQNGLKQVVKHVIVK